MSSGAARATIVVLTGVFLLAGCGETGPDPRPAASPDPTTTEAAPREPAAPPDQEGPPPVTLRFLDETVDLPAWTYCYGNLCADADPALRPSGRRQSGGGRGRVPAPGLVVHRELPSGRRRVRTRAGGAARARRRRQVRAPAGRPRGHLRRHPLRPRRRRPLHDVPLDDARRRCAAHTARAARAARRPRRPNRQLRRGARADQPGRHAETGLGRITVRDEDGVPSPSTRSAPASAACPRAPSTGTAPTSRAWPPRPWAMARSPTGSSSCSTAPVTSPRLGGRPTRSPATSRRWRCLFSAGASGAFPSLSLSRRASIRSSASACSLPWRSSCSCCACVRFPTRVATMTLVSVGIRPSPVSISMVPTRRPPVDSGNDVAVADGGHRLDRPPEREAEAREDVGLDEPRQGRRPPGRG